MEYDSLWFTARGSEFLPLNRSLRELRTVWYAHLRIIILLRYNTRTRTAKRRTKRTII